jgi:hypothetical protein
LDSITATLILIMFFRGRSCRVVIIKGTSFPCLSTHPLTFPFAWAIDPVTPVIELVSVFGFGTRKVSIWIEKILLHFEMFERIQLYFCPSSNLQEPTPSYSWLWSKGKQIKISFWSKRFCFWQILSIVFKQYALFIYKCNWKFGALWVLNLNEQ